LERGIFVDGRYEEWECRTIEQEMMERTKIDKIRMDYWGMSGGSLLVN
jgi:hypothetical protein